MSGRSMVNPGARLSVNLRPRKAADPKGTASEVIQRIRSLIEERGLQPGIEASAGTGPGGCS